MMFYMGDFHSGVSRFLFYPGELIPDMTGHSSCGLLWVCMENGGQEGFIMVKINGEACDASGKTITEYLQQAGYDPVRVAVEHNGVIVSKTGYADTVLEDGDEVEVVSFVGGG